MTISFCLKSLIKTQVRERTLDSIVPGALVANIEKADEKEYTPVMLVARQGHTEVVEGILAAGAEAKKGTKYGPYAWDNANDLGRTSVASVLQKGKK